MNRSVEPMISAHRHAQEVCVLSHQGFPNSSVIPYDVISMISTRNIVLLLMVTVPVLAYLILGAYALWQTGLFGYTFWILPVCWLITWGLAALWKAPSVQKLQDEATPRHFTPRDESAMEIVKRYQEQVDELTPQQLIDPKLYFQQAQKLAQELSVHYHPKAEDPISSLTVPEVLAAARLVIDDMERWMLDSVPGSQLVTIRQWKWLQHAPKWVTRAQNAAWAIGVLMNPANVLKYATSQLTLSPVTKELQAEFLAVVYLRFMRQMGFYLIEMNSGRLRGGADRYRRTFGTETAPSTDRTTSPEPAAENPNSAGESLAPESLTVALVGQVKAGKSSLVNALVGADHAVSDVLPATSHVQRFQLSIPDSDVRLTLLDTPGYADAGITTKQLGEVQQALRSADVLLLVMAANSPARSADRQMLDQLKAWYETQPMLKPAPVVICLTHIDLLSPVMEWNPPYRWQTPTTRKEESIHAAVAHVQELFGESVETIVPVCSDVARNRASNVVEELLPALLQILSEGQMAALLRAYHKHISRERFKKFAHQIKNSGKNLLQVWLEERVYPARPGEDAIGESGKKLPQ